MLNQLGLYVLSGFLICKASNEVLDAIYFIVFYITFQGYRSLTAEGYNKVQVCSSESPWEYILCVCVCENRWLWIAQAVKSLLMWISWWRGSFTVAASPAVRKVPRRGRWCSCIQQTTSWTFRHYLTPSAALSLTLCPLQTLTLISMPTLTKTITLCRIHQTEGRSVIWLLSSFCSSLPPSLFSFTLHHLYRSVVF